MASLPRGGRRRGRAGPGRHLLSEAGLHRDLQPRTVHGHSGVGDFPQRLDAIGGRGERVDVQARVVLPAVLHQREPAEAGDTVVEGCGDAELRVIGEGDVWFAKRTAVAYLCRVGHQCRVKRGVDIDLVAALRSSSMARLVRPCPSRFWSASAYNVGWSGTGWKSNPLSIQVLAARFFGFAATMPWTGWWPKARSGSTS